MSSVPLQEDARGIRSYPFFFLLFVIPHYKASYILHCLSFEAQRFKILQIKLLSFVVTCFSQVSVTRWALLHGFSMLERIGWKLQKILLQGDHAPTLFFGTISPGLHNGKINVKPLVANNLNKRTDSDKSSRKYCVYLSNSNGSNVFTVRGCTISGTKSSRQKTSNSFPCNATVNRVFWRWRCSWQPRAGVVISHRLNYGGQYPSKYPKHPCGADSRHSPLTWKAKNMIENSSIGRTALTSHI